VKTSQSTLGYATENGNTQRGLSPQAKPWCYPPEIVIPITTLTKSLSDE